MSEIDEVSRAIGDLQAMARVRGKIEDERDIVLNSKVDKVLAGFSIMESRIANCEKGVDDYTQMKKRGIYAILGLSVASGTTAPPILTKIMEWFMGSA